MRKYIKPSILILNDTFENNIIETSVTATAPDCPWDNEDGEEWGNEIKIIKISHENYLED